MNILANKIDEFDSQPEYYQSGGLDPLGAYEKGLLTKDEYIGFLKGNIIKYVIRAGKKEGEDSDKDLEKAKTYIKYLKSALKN